MSRSNCVNALDKALQVDGSSDTSNIAQALESSIKEKNGADEAQYKNDIRSKISNIKSNSQLRHDLLAGTVAPTTLAQMGPEDMATEEKKAENAAIRAESAEDAVMVNTIEATNTDNELDTGIARNTGQDGIEYDAP